ncbi:MAG TPA: hypothetical protein VGO22_10790 [Pseudorhizobium sp.]|jgi:hypothetical protein|nr:hypothetical protein [Pseudorhizobium sp.]
MVKVLLEKTYKARKPGVTLDIPQSEAEAVERLGLGKIVGGQKTAPKKTEKPAAE